MSDEPVSDATEAYIRRVVDQAPSLTNLQRDQLAALLRPGQSRTDDDDDEASHDTTTAVRPHRATLSDCRRSGCVAAKKYPVTAIASNA